MGQHPNVRITHWIDCQEIFIGLAWCPYFYRSEISQGLIEYICDLVNIKACILGFYPLAFDVTFIIIIR
jgi:hypothetical protein